MSSAIADRFFAEIDLSGLRNVHTFIRIPKLNEIDTSAIYFRIWRDWPSAKTLAPRMAVRSGELESVEFDDSTQMIVNDWGISEPVGEAIADPKSIDVVLLPLLCFDEFGNRVGYGKGFYDRFLARCRPNCMKVGLSLFPPAALIDGINENDVPLDICVTPERSYRFGQGADRIN